MKLVIVVDAPQLQRAALLWSMVRRIEHMIDLYRGANSPIRISSSVQDDDRVGDFSATDVMQAFPPADDEPPVLDVKVESHAPVLFAMDPSDWPLKDDLSSSGEVEREPVDNT